jgi:hypothetical protein
VFKQSLSLIGTKRAGFAYSQTPKTKRPHTNTNKPPNGKTKYEKSAPNLSLLPFNEGE